jgi:hypothetical protein
VVIIRHQSGKNRSHQYQIPFNCGQRPFAVRVNGEGDLLLLSACDPP